MDQRRRAYAAGGVTIGIFVVIQLGAVALVDPFEGAGYQAVSNPADPTNSLAYIVAILVATAAMLAVIKLGVQWLLRGFVVLSSGFVSLYVFSVLAPPVAVSVVGIPFNPLAVGAAVVLAVALLVYPEWYVIDAAGVVMGAGAAGIFGISFGLLPAVVLLLVLAIYDAISVYGTEHMLTLADGVMDLKLPVILVIPLTLTYSFLDDAATTGENGGDDGAVEADGGERAEGARSSSVERGVTDRREVTKRTATEGSHERSESDGGEHERATSADRPGAGERDVFFVGLGDAVMPGVLVASAAFFGSAPPLVSGFALTLPALTAMAGTVCGLVVLLRLVLKGRAHAGLPLLNGGAIGGYLVGAVVSGIPVVTALGLGPYL